MTVPITPDDTSLPPRVGAALEKAPSRTRGRFRRALAAVASAVGLSAVFTGALVGSVLLHLNAAPMRRVVRTVANAILSDLFVGKIVVGEIDHLDLHSLSVRSAAAVDDRGVEAIRIRNLSADTDVLGILRSAISGPELKIVIPRITVEDSEVSLESGTGGEIMLAYLFNDPPGQKPGKPGGRPVRVDLGHITIGHSHARGMVSAGTLVDADAANIVGSVLVDGDGVRVAVGKTPIECLSPTPQPAKGVGTFDLRARKGQHPAMTASFEGTMGALPLRADAGMEDRHLSGTVDIPRATPEAIAGLLPEGTKLPLRVPVAVHAHAEGDRPDLTYTAHVDLEGGGKVDTEGHLILGEPPRINGTVALSEVDPRAFVDIARAKPANAHARVALELSSSPKGTIDFTTGAFSLDGNVIPAVDGKVVLEGKTLRGDTQIHEQGAPTHAVFSLDEGQALRFEVDTEASTLRRVRRIDAPIDGAARVKVKGTLADNKLDAQVSGHVDRFRAPGGVEMERGSVDGHVQGPLSALRVDASVRGQSLHAAEYSWETMRARATGPLLSPQLETELDTGTGTVMRVAAKVDRAKGGFREVSFREQRSEGDVTGHATSVRFAGGAVEVDNLEIEGASAGALKGALVVRGRELSGKLHGDAVDLAKVAHLAGLDQRIGGIANVDIDLSVRRPGDRKGHVDIEVENGFLGGLSGLSGNFSLDFEGDRIRADGYGRLVGQGGPDDPCSAGIAQIRVSHGDGQLPGGLLDPAAWTAISGKVEIAADDWNLRCLAKQTPLGMAFSDVGGKLTTRVTLKRDPSDRLPSIRNFFAKTRGLTLVGPVEEGKAPPWESKAVDLEVRGKFDGTTGRTEAMVSVQDDAEVGRVAIKTRIDLPELLDHPERTVDILRSAPISAQLSIPTRQVGAFASLPSFVRERLPPLAGEVTAQATIRGSIDHPLVDVHLDGHDLAQVLPPPPAPAASGNTAATPEATSKPASAEAILSLGPWGIPIDVTFDGHYDGSAAALSARIVHQGKEVIAADTTLAVPWSDVLEGRPVKPKGTVMARVTELPFGEIPYFADRDIGGHLSGIATLAGIGEKPTLKADLRLPDLRLGQDLFFDDGSFTLVVDRPTDPNAPSDSGVATARLELVAQDGGKLTTNTSANVRWQSGMLPLPDDQKPASIHTKAEHFRVAAFAPFVSSVVSRLDGLLDGEADLGWARPGDDDDAKVAVRMSLTKGVFNLPQLGQEFHDAKLTVSGDGKGDIFLKDFSAEGTRGKVKGSATAHFAGLKFVRGNVNLSIAKGEEIPVTFEGVPFGDARGEVDLRAEKRGKDLLLNLTIPKLHLDLPAAIARSVQSLDADPNITITSGATVATESRGKDASRILMTVNLGAIQVVSRMLDIELTGSRTNPLQIEVADKTSVTGEIHVVRGRVEVVKKQFDIEQCQVTMQAEDVSNPNVNVRARWDSPEGPVFINYRGNLFPIEDKKLTFESQPPATKEQILAMLLMGGQDQATLTGTKGSMSALAQSPATALLLQQFNASLFGGKLRTDLSMSDAQTLKPGIVYQEDKAQIGLSVYDGVNTNAATTATTGLSSGTMTGDSAARGTHKVFTFDWRFFRHWLLRGHVDVGSEQTNSGVDVLWQYRY